MLTTFNSQLAKLKNSTGGYWATDKKTTQNRVQQQQQQQQQQQPPQIILYYLYSKVVAQLTLESN
jgi:hypothetical protein